MAVTSALESGLQYEILSKSSLAYAQSFVLGSKSSSNRSKEYKKIVEQYALSSQKAKWLQAQNVEKKTIGFVGQQNHIWILQASDVKKTQHAGKLDESSYTYYRDQAASLLVQLKAQQLEELSVNLVDVNSDDVRAMIVGLELASYSFLARYKNEKVKPIKISFVNHSKLKSNKIDKALLQSAQVEAQAAVLARHLVNLPPNDINPETVEKLIKTDAKFKSTSVKVDVWDHKKLDSENMHLHLAVGKGSDTPPRMVHIKYRPKKKSNKKPIAFVGKGITFDTGGLDIKPSSAMRLMKKDMGGAAAVIGLAYWVINSNYGRACDFYLALAENSVDANAMRPSDVYKSRAGYLVEIDNTDAEGRLVLADVMDVAAKQKGADEPEYLVDLATLTGAIKVALGADVAGLFSNDDKLAQEIESAGQATGELNWRMPLVQKYFSSLSSNFADFKNSADGFGGAITAALFLEKFCGGKKWAHLDIYSWTDKANGALLSAGGNGQPVQSLIHWLKSKA